MSSTDTHTDKPADETTAETTGKPPEPPKEAQEYGGPKEERPTRYGDWTVKGRCIDF
ncbi:DUF1674 domain-containing protein [Gluconacetobacter tumulisoli]|uniref:DUF1674 domain-containing protein n=1 Tax=Gluconacetobacter tumulisoli TaxID=1286189 RepID=A0A7W4K4D7_9PROT|nr:DUF1674 domain-containing protein [Gluconacetobacter tumulisoli]MBB2200158.1 DUF1674 domain-containing protein [Gluconacetobacter tumulisoli]